MSETLIKHSYGFIYGLTEKGLVNVARLHTDDKVGTYIGIETASQDMQIRITPGGKIIPLGVHKKKKGKKEPKFFYVPPEAQE